MAADREKSTLHVVAEELAAGIAAPFGMWLMWQLQDEASTVRVKLAELLDALQELSIRARVEALIHSTKGQP